MVSWMVSWWFRDGFVNLRNHPRNRRVTKEKRTKPGNPRLRYSILYTRKRAKLVSWHRLHAFVTFSTVSWWFRNGFVWFRTVSSGFRRLWSAFSRKTCAGNQKFFFPIFSIFSFFKKRFFKHFCKIFSKNIFKKLLIFCRRKKIVCDVCDNMYVTFICFFKNVSFST